jgi:hypothetical protein
VLQGFDSEGKYNPDEHTDKDKEKRVAAEAIIKKSWSDIKAGGKSWKAILNKDGSPLESGTEAYQMYDSSLRVGTSVTRIIVDAEPSQVTARWLDERGGVSKKSSVGPATYTTRTWHIVVRPARPSPPRKPESRLTLPTHSSRPPTQGSLIARPSTGA